MLWFTSSVIFLQYNLVGTVLLALDIIILLLFFNKIIVSQACTHDRFWREWKVDLLDSKCGLFKPHSLNPPTKIQSFAHFVTKNGPFGKLGLVCCTPSPSYGPGVVVACICQYMLVWKEVLTISFLLPIHPSIHPSQLSVCVSICWVHFYLIIAHMSSFSSSLFPGI